MQSGTEFFLVQVLLPVQNMFYFVTSSVLVSTEISDWSLLLRLFVVNLLVVNSL